MEMICWLARARDARTIRLFWAASLVWPPRRRFGSPTPSLARVGARASNSRRRPLCACSLRRTSAGASAPRPAHPRARKRIQCLPPTSPEWRAPSARPPASRAACWSERACRRRRALKQSAQVCARDRGELQASGALAAPLLAPQTLLLLPLLVQGARRSLPPARCNWKLQVATLAAQAPPRRRRRRARACNPGALARAPCAPAPAQPSGRAGLLAMQMKEKTGQFAGLTFNQLDQNESRPRRLPLTHLLARQSQTRGRRPLRESSPATPRNGARRRRREGKSIGRQSANLRAPAAFAALVTWLLGGPTSRLWLAAALVAERPSQRRFAKANGLSQANGCCLAAASHLRHLSRSTQVTCATPRHRARQQASKLTGLPCARQPSLPAPGARVRSSPRSGKRARWRSPNPQVVLLRGSGGRRARKLLGKYRAD